MELFNIINITILSNVCGNVLWAVLGIIGGGIAGFFLARWYFKKELEKNPPINEKQIRAMLMQMGQQPSEKKIRQIMKAMEQNR